jgi:hypothetical protein
LLDLLLVLAELGALDRLGGGSKAPSSIAERGADGLAADIEPDQPPALRQRVAEFCRLRRDQRARNAFTLRSASARTLAQNSG